jgi:UDP-3-O-[3-hydroxymyristoyl] N-acetylglucosamine deacetylase
MQATIRSDVSFSGVGLHTGRLVRMTIRPHAANMGLWFRRLDLPGAPYDRRALRPRRAQPAVHAARRNGGASVSTIEHVMAALAGCGIHNALVEVDGPEVPILDGSAAPFVRGILDAASSGRTRAFTPSK